MRWSPLVLASWLSAVALAQRPFESVLDALRAPASPAQVEAMRAFAARMDAPAAIPELLDRLRDEAPRLDNNGCLLLEWILREHPDATCPVDGLLDVLARPIWNSRQKAAQALLLALRPETMVGQEERLARAVLPLLTSQRSRVYEAGAKCLTRIAGRDLGTDPVVARRWFFERFGKGIDLHASVHEVVLVVREADGGFDVQGRRVADPSALTDTLRRSREQAEGLGLEVGVVFVVPAERVAELVRGERVPAVDRVVQAAASAGVGDTTVAPETDGFRAPFVEPDEPRDLRDRLQARVDALRSERVPGVQAAVVLPDGRLWRFVSGLADRERGLPMPSDGRLLAGSTGKTFFAALALQLVREARLDLDARLATFLGTEPWFERLPNAGTVTLRHLMQHRSGIPRYEFDPAFLQALRERPDHRFAPVEEIAFVLDRQPACAAGDGFEYADTNYVLLGLVLERVTGRPNHEEIQRRFLGPLGLRGTVPSVGREVPGLVQGYAGERNPFGGRDAMLVDGRLPFDPGFEGAGGGYASTAADLARWAKALYEGEVLAGVRDQALAGSPAPFGPGAQYGLGVMIETTELGPAVGHSGFFPGWLTTMRYFPERKVAVAVMVNSSADLRVARQLTACAADLAEAASR